MPTRRILAVACLLVGAAAFDGGVPAPLGASSTVVPVPVHEVGQSYMFLRVYDDSVVVRLEIRTDDLERVLSLGWDPDASVTLAQVEQRLAAIRGYAEPRFELSAAGRVMSAEFRGVGVMSIDIGDFVELEYFIDAVDGVPDLVEIFYSVIFEVDRLHRNFLVIEHNWKTATFNNEAVFSLVFSPGTDRQSLDLSSSSWLKGFVGLIWLGVLHIWIGIDHILFLLALVLPSVLMRREGRWHPVGSFRHGFFNILAIVTCFTIAHSVTLALAGFDVVRLPSRLVESVIAGSIAVAAAANLAPGIRVKEWAIAFGFGLFHGFGFASVMGDIGVGRDHLVMSVFGFNVGVEIGQVAIIVLVFPALFFLRIQRGYLHLMRWGSFGLIAVALVWLGERASGIDVPLTAIVLWVPRTIGGVLGLGT